MRVGTWVAGRRRDREIVAAARGLHERGLVVGSVGNVSVRVAGGARITPSRLDYDQMAPRDLVTVAPGGRVLAGGRTPSRESALHLAVYAAHSQATAIVHTHSPHAAAWSFLGEPLQPATEELEYFGIGPVATARRAPPGSAELAAATVEGLGTSRAVLLGGHGLVSWGATLREAVTIAEAVEHQAQLAWLLRGSPTTPG